MTRTPSLSPRFLVHALRVLGLLPRLLLDYTSHTLSFGSFGDVVSAVDLALRIAKALKSSFYGISIPHPGVQRSRLRPPDRRRSHPHWDAATRRRERHPPEVSRCRSIMGGLMERTKGYQKALGTNQGGAVGGSWRKNRLGAIQDTRYSRNEGETRDPSNVPHDSVQSVRCFAQAYCYVCAPSRSHDHLQISRQNLDELRGLFIFHQTRYTWWSDSSRRSSVTRAQTGSSQGLVRHRNGVAYASLSGSTPDALDYLCRCWHEVVSDGTRWRPAATWLPTL